MDLKGIKTYLFDFDGTLVNSVPTFASAVISVLEENNISYPKDIVKTVTPLGLEGTAAYFIDELGLDLPKEYLMDGIIDRMREKYKTTIPLKENVETTLRELKSRCYSLNILTASPHKILDMCVKRLGIWEIFDNVWSCDDFGTTKADPAIYLRIAEKLKKRPQEILFLDDNINSNKTANKAGMLTCGVYDEASDDMVEKMKKTTDYYIYDFSELL